MKSPSSVKLSTLNSLVSPRTLSVQTSPTRISGEATASGSECELDEWSKYEDALESSLDGSRSVLSVAHPTHPRTIKTASWIKAACKKSRTQKILLSGLKLERPSYRGREHRMCQERIPIERPDAASRTKSVEIIVFEMNFSRRRTNAEGKQETHQARAIVSPHEISLGGYQL